MDALPFFELHKICRICLKTDLLVSIFSPSFLVRPVEMIEKLNIFKYNMDDGLPTLLCQSCLYRLLDAYSLKQLSESSECRLHDYLKNATGASTLGLSAGAGAPNDCNSLGFSKSSYENCFSPTSANGSKDAGSVGIYENIYDIFERNASNDIEVEDDVLNDVVIDVSSLTRSEADEDSLSLIPTECSLAERTRGFQQKDITLITSDNSQQTAYNAAVNRNGTNSSKALKTPKECVQCGKTFNAGYMEVHMRTHTGERPFQCKICPKNFTQSGNLLLHMRTHTGERRFQCEVCASFFTTSSNLKAHKLTHLEKREFSCQQCSLLFKTQRDLKKHEPVHKTTKDIVCTLCQKAFTKSSYLSAHMSAVHRGNRKHSCLQCHRVFGSRSNLVCHMRTHNGEKPFQCKHCAWKFSQSSALARHMKKHVEQSFTDAIGEINSEALITDYLREPKIEALPSELMIIPEATQLGQQNELANFSQLNTQLMEVSGADFTLPASSSLQAYGYSKEISDFSSNQQHRQDDGIYDDEDFTRRTLK